LFRDFIIPVKLTFSLPDKLSEVKKLCTIVTENSVFLFTESCVLLFTDYKKEYSFNSFLFSITYNAILNHYKKKSREKKYLDQIVTEHTSETNETSLQVEYDSLLELAMQTIEELPDKRKLVFKLSRFEGLSNKEIAVQLHLSKRTVENHIQLALRSLRQKLGKELLFAILLLLHLIS